MNTSKNPHELITELAALNKSIHEILQNSYFDSLALLKRDQIEKKIAVVCSVICSAFISASI